MLEKKYPARQYPGADRMLVRYYTVVHQPEKIEARFGKELPDYLKDMIAAPPRETTPVASVPAPVPAPTPAPAPVTNSIPETLPSTPDQPKDNPDGDVGETETPTETQPTEAP